jgi:ABC-type uncharacterized transport system permease subunit
VKLKDKIFSDKNSAALSSILAIIVGLLFGFIILLISDPQNALNGFMTILSGGFAGGLRGVGNVFYYAVPVMMTGLGVAFAFKTGLFNIGGPGQFIVGAYLAILVAIRFTFLPGCLKWIVPLIVAMLGGALWAAIPGLLNAYFKVNIVIGTIMMNYIGMYLVNYLIKLTVFDSTKNMTLPIPYDATLPTGGLDKIFPASSINIGIYIALLMVVIAYIILEKTRLGYELKACGFNRDAAKYAGINEKRSIIISMMISGALMGIGGALMYLSASGKHISVVDVLAPEGFNGIPVALLALNNPFGVFFAGLFIAYITVAGFYMQSYGFVPEIIDMIISTIIYFSAFALVLRGIISKAVIKSEHEGKGGTK